MHRSSRQSARRPGRTGSGTPPRSCWRRPSMRWRNVRRADGEWIGAAAEGDQRSRRPILAASAASTGGDNRAGRYVPPMRIHTPADELTLDADLLIIWSYDYGAKPRRRWPAKHDTILVYARTPGEHHFDADAVEREPYMAPGLVSSEKAAKGKRPTDVWFHTIVPTNGREKTGYPTQKPEGVLRRIVTASSRPNCWCLDPFAGSGTLGAVCRQLGRRFVLVDDNPMAIEIMRKRLAPEEPGRPEPGACAV